MEEERKIEELQRLIDTHENIVFFGGAGVSTESGIPDFRSVDGLYHQKYDVPPETILSHSYFLRYPEKFYAFYRDKMLPVGAKPNAAHKKLAELEAAGKLKAVVTQNIDGLHQAAGSRVVYELHGSTHRNYCMKCGAACDTELVRKSSGVPRCEKCGGMIKPDVVLYEESLNEKVLDGAIRSIAAADLLIVGGTSLAVYPAAGLLQYFQGDALVLINKGATPMDKNADLLIQQPIGQVLGSKPHPCGSSEWEILRVGADFRLKCTGCGHQIMVARKLVEKNTRGLRKKDA